MEFWARFVLFTGVSPKRLKAGTHLQGMLARQACSSSEVLAESRKKVAESTNEATKLFRISRGVQKLDTSFRPTRRWGRAAWELTLNVQNLGLPAYEIGQEGPYSEGNGTATFDGRFERQNRISLI